jgi:hypothetical protein
VLKRRRLSSKRAPREAPSCGSRDSIADAVLCMDVLHAVFRFVPLWQHPAAFAVCKTFRDGLPGITNAIVADGRCRCLVLPQWALATCVPYLLPFANVQPSTAR